MMVKGCTYGPTTIGFVAVQVDEVDDEVDDDVDEEADDDDVDDEVDDKVDQGEGLDLWTIHCWVCSRPG